MCATSGQKNLVTQARFEFRRAAVPANRMEIGHAPLVEDDGVIAFDTEEAVVESSVMKRAEAEAVFQFVSSALMVDRNDVRGVHKVELHSADCAAVSVGSQNILAEARIAHLPIDLLQHCFAWPCRNVSDFAFDVSAGDPLKLSHLLGLLGCLVEFLKLLNVCRNEIRAERDDDFLVVTSLREERFRLCFVHGLSPYLQGR